jgi:hypothetical protein
MPRRPTHGLRTALAASAALLLAVLILPMQVYAWSAAEGHWGPPKPLATLFLGDVLSATHSEGPLWQHTDGSKVVGAVVASATVDAAAIPWLLLHAASRSGPGLFADVTYVQRLNTKGGLAPAGPGSADGAQVQVHYEADYLFYHAHAP